MALPQPNAGWIDKARELWNAAQATTYKPTFYQKNTPASAAVPDENGAPVRSRPKGRTDVTWWTNWAYYATYPDAAATIAPGDQAAADAWTRINTVVASLVDSARPPNPDFDPTAVVWPLLTAPTKIRPGAKFGAKRPAKGPQTRYHTGCDLAANLGAAVVAPEPGVVIAPNSGWEMKKVGGVWKGVKSLLLVSDSGRTWLLGGIRPDSAVVKKDERVVAGQKLAEIGAYPGGDTMLHVSLYDAPLTEYGVGKQKSWSTSGSRPANLIDAQPLLEAAAKNPRKALYALAVPVNEDIEGAEETEGTPEGEGPGDAVEKGKAGGAVVGGVAALLVALAVGRR